MSSDLQSECVDIIVSALDKRASIDVAARSIKESLDRKFGSSWRCIVGDSFGFAVTHQEAHALHMYYQGQLAVLVFKC